MNSHIAKETRRPEAECSRTLSDLPISKWRSGYGDIERRRRQATYLPRLLRAQLQLAIAA